MNSGLLLREAPEAFRSYDAEHSWLVTWIVMDSILGLAAKKFVPSEKSA